MADIATLSQNHFSADGSYPWSPPSDQGPALRAWVNDCWEDLQRRWDSNQRLSVDQLISPSELAKLPPDVAVDLIYCEFAVRIAVGEDPDREEFARRFPKFEPLILRQIVLDDALQELSSTPEVFQEETESYADTIIEPPSSATLVPTQIGKYRVLRQLGTGGQSEVYLAWHPDLSKEVVVKLSRPSTNMSADARRRFEVEAVSLANLDHPNLIRVYDRDLHDNRPYLVMDFVRGRTLDIWIRDEQPSAEKVALLFSKLANGLAAAHRQGILHLDIKPANILIDEQGEPRLIDFGLARRNDVWDGESGTDMGIVGTLQFMSPEQASGLLGQLTAQADVFSLGASLYFALTQQPPYLQAPFAQLRQQVVNGTWDAEALDKSDAPENLREVCRWSMKYQQSDRIPGMEAFANELTKCIKKPAEDKRKILIMAMPMLAVVVLALIASQFKSPAPAVPAALEPLTVKVESEEQGKLVGITDRLPLSIGDKITVEATIPAGSHASLLLWSSEGQLEELVRHPPSADEFHLRYPPDRKTGAPIEGESGTEALLLITSTKGPIDLKELKQRKEFQEKWPLIPDTVVVAVPRNAAIESAQKPRGLGVPKNLHDDPEDLIRGRLEEMQRDLSHKQMHLQSLTFSHADDR